MRVYIEPLKGKYYGTDIVFGDNSITVWAFGNDWEPSDRALAQYGYTRKQWNNNELVDNGWGGKSPVQEMDLNCDSHFESDYGYKIACVIRDALDEYLNGAQSKERK